MRKLLVLLNVGLDDQKEYGIPNGPGTDEPPRENDVIEVDDEVANAMVNVIHVAKDYDHEEVKKHKAKVRKDDEKRIESAEATLGADVALAHRKRLEGIDKAEVTRGPVVARTERAPEVDKAK